MKINKHEIAIISIVPNYSIASKEFLIQSYVKVDYFYNNTQYTINIKTSVIDGNEIKDKIVEVLR